MSERCRLREARAAGIYGKRSGCLSGSGDLTTGLRPTTGHYDAIHHPGGRYGLAQRLAEVSTKGETKGSHLSLTPCRSFGGASLWLRAGEGVEGSASPSLPSFASGEGR